MGISSIQHNMLMVNAGRHMNINTKKKASTAERLSSGYKINRAADDAAGLSISEKMRYMIRGLQQGTENAMDGVSWVQIGDGSLEEVHSMLHRMTELAIKSSNGTNTDDDRAMMQAEFAHLQKEIDRLTDNTTFNEQHIFQEHEWPYHQIEGSTYWSPTEYHTVREEENDLVISYAINEKDPIETVSIKVAAGKYTTKELVDEIDTQLEKAGLLEKGIRFNYNDRGFCDLSLEGGRIIDEVSGGLSYLLYENFGGGDLGALIGTTRFPDADMKILEVENDSNGQMTFQLLNPEDISDKTEVVINLPTRPGDPYSKKELIDILNEQMAAALEAAQKTGTVTAVSEGEIIKISSPDYIVSEFEGNMFKLGDEFSSVFYDNIKEADNVQLYEAKLTGGYVVRDYSDYQTRTADPEGSVFHFSAGDCLVLNPNGRGELVIDMEPMNHKSIYDVKQYLQSKFDAFEYTDEDGNTQTGAGLKVYVNSVQENTSFIDQEGYPRRLQMAGLEIQSEVKGRESTIGIDKARSTAYAALFTSRRVSPNYQNDAVTGGNDTKPDTNDYLLGLRTLGAITIAAGKNDSFEIKHSSGQWETITLDADTYANAGALAVNIQKKLDEKYGVDKFKVTATTSSNNPLDPPANRIRIEAGSSGMTSIRVQAHTEDSGEVNTGYRDIFEGWVRTPETVSAPAAVNSTILLPEIKTLDGDGKITISPGEGLLCIKLNGDERSVNLTGTWTPDEIKAKIEAAFPTKEEPYKFNPIDAKGTTTTRETKATSTQNGETKSTASTYDQYKEKTGYTESNEGDPARPFRNDPPQITFAKAITGAVKITAVNKDFDFKLNGADIHIDLSTELGATEFANADDFAAALQEAIKTKTGKAPNQTGGVKVTCSGGVLTLTAGLFTNEDGTGGQSFGSRTKLEMIVNKEGGFIYNLHDASEGAKATLTATQSDGQKVPLNTNFGTATIDLKVTKPDGTTETISVSVNGASSLGLLRSNINNALAGKNITANVTQASYYDYSSVTFTTTGDWKGNGYKIEILDTSTLKDKLFAFSNGTLTEKTGASASPQYTSGPYTYDRPMKFTDGKIVFKENQSFVMTVDGVEKTVTINQKDEGYDADQMKAEMQRALDAAFGADKVVANMRSSGSTRYLSFATVSKEGPASTIKLTYQETCNGKTSALRTIFGANEVGGVKASFEQVDGDPNKVQLRLTRIPNDDVLQDKGTISVTSNDQPSKYESIYKGGSFIYPNTTYEAPKYEPGYHSSENSFLQGVSLKLTNGKVQIDEFNNDLTFFYARSYSNDGNNNNDERTKISFTLDDGMYTPNELVAALQQKINDTPGVGEGKLKVLIKNNGIRIETVPDEKGSLYRIYTKNDYKQTYPGNYDYRPSGDFYDKILCSNGLQKKNSPTMYDRDGFADGALVYAMGRQDVKNTTTKIQKDGNDSLSLRFTTPDNPDGYILEMKLDPGYYKGDELAKQIQAKLDQALSEAGMKEGMIEVLVGYEPPRSTNVTGSINDRALAFKLSETLPLPDNGKYKIDMIGGTAAFSVFYATDGDIARAYVRGGKDISKGAQIRNGNNTLSVDVDDKHYFVELDPGKYTTAELLSHMNEKFKDGNVPLRAYEDGGRLKLMHTKYGIHSIKHLAGGVKNDLFFRESGEWAGNQPMRLRVSGVSGDWIEVDKPWMDTSSLGINTLTIEKYKNAQKAITRLKKAVTKASEVRSYFGALQNRLESTVRNNQNKIENTTAAESRIRDADFSKETVENSIHSILEQTGTSMMAQIMQNSKLALQLLQ